MATTTHEDHGQAARQDRMAYARKFARDHGLTPQAGDALAQALDLEHGMDLRVLEDLGSPELIEAAAYLMPRAAHGPDHERGAREHLMTACRMGAQGRDHAARHLAEAGREITQADDRRTEAQARRERASRAEQAVPEQQSAADPIATAYLAALASQDSVRVNEIAGAVTADQILRAQFDHGLSADQVEARQESVVAGLFSEAISHAEKAFANSYASVVDTYTSDFRELEREAE